jgi:putative (di)nucleoside polyphosphate hydrolase
VTKPDDYITEAEDAVAEEDGEVTGLPYRDGVGVMLFNASGRVFVARRIDMSSEAWQMPQGGIDPGETLRAAALRELEEEIGTAKAEVIAEGRDWLTYEFPHWLLPKVWDGRYLGQRQKWFAMRFTGDDADINIATETPEFLDWKWEDINLLPEIIVPFKRRLYQDIISEFGHLALPRSSVS